MTYYNNHEGELADQFHDVPGVAEVDNLRIAFGETWRELFGVYPSDDLAAAVAVCMWRRGAL